MLERWEINHEQRLDGNLKFTPWPSTKDRDEGQRGNTEQNEKKTNVFNLPNLVEIQFTGFECVYLMCRNDITKSSFINCSNSVDDAKWRKANGVYFNLMFSVLFDACLSRSSLI